MKYMILLGALMIVSSNAKAQSSHQLVDVERRVLCESRGQQATLCKSGLEREYTARFDKQISAATCSEEESFAIKRGTIHVKNGCRAYFIVKGATAFPLYTDKVSGYYFGQRYWSHEISEMQKEHMETVSEFLFCSSYKQRDEICTIPLDNVEKVTFYSRSSSAPCVEGESYKIKGRYIEVSKGCRASFYIQGTRIKEQAAENW